MDELVLEFPVHTLDGRMVLPADTRLDDETMAQVVWQGGALKSSWRTLFDHPWAARDLAEFMHVPPYNAIFCNNEVNASCLTLMGEVELIDPFLEVLTYFRQRDPCTYRHMLMVFALTTLLARDLVPDYVERLRGSLAGPTHDFGKICVPLSILTKGSPLTRAERRHLEHHPLAGFVLLSYYLRDPRHLSARVARDHHERRDGSGYPLGQRELDSLVEIIAVCDIYDALVSPRPYRPVCFDNRTALEEITRLAECGKIGWHVVKALVAHNRGVPFDPVKVWVSAAYRGQPPSGNVYGVYADLQ